MALMEFTVRHQKTRADAKRRLELAVEQLRRQYGPMIRRIEWSSDRESVRIEATGADASLRVDDEAIHAAIDVPMLGGLLGGRLAEGLKTIVRKQLT